MYQGTIKRLTDKGFGFIAMEGQENDLFFHASSLVGIEYNSLREGDAVVFDMEETEKGMNAVNVKLASEAGDAAPATDDAEMPAEAEGGEEAPAEEAGEEEAAA